jgi:hypothetical protein
MAAPSHAITAARHRIGQAVGVAMSPGSVPRLDKYIWTDDDFAVMGWHDAKVHALAFEPAPDNLGGQLLIDLDYIIEWVTPEPPQQAFRFWISPATLVFDSAADLRGDLDLYHSFFELTLNAIERSEPDGYMMRQWTLDGHNFKVTFRSTGYRQYMRRSPLLVGEQRLSLHERGGLSFSQTTT